MMKGPRALWVLGWVCLLACGPKPVVYDWALPPGFPEPFVPEDNPMSASKAELGRHLFYDVRLSGNATMSCASCHEPQRAFSDGKVTPSGSTGDAVPRNAPGLANVGYLTTFGWANPVLDSLERHALVPMYGEAPVELGMTGKVDEILGRFASDPRYIELFDAAFPEEEAPLQGVNLVKALAAFQRTLISGNSPFDRFNNGETTALSPSAKRGFDLFFSEKAECYHCHGGLNLTSSFRSSTTTAADRPFQNTGLYNLDGTGRYPAPNVGLFEFTSVAEDMGKFRPPSLRNVALTAPYMHDGTIATLGEVVDFYMAGGRNITVGSNLGDGRANPYKSNFVRTFFLTGQERLDLIAFLESFTDETFVSNPRFSNPLPQ